MQADKSAGAIRRPAPSRNGPLQAAPKSQPHGIATEKDIIWYSESAVTPNTLVRFDPKAETFQTWAILSGGGVVGNMLMPLVGSTVLVGYQVFRVPLEWVLHELYVEGVIAAQMTYAGRNFNAVTGILVTIAVLSTPVPFRYFVNEPANLLSGTFPFVWLPTFLVQAALFGHILVFRAIW